MKFVKNLEIQNWSCWKADENFDSGTIKTIECYLKKFDKEMNC